MKRILLCVWALFFCVTGQAGQEIPVAPYLPAQAPVHGPNAPITVQFPQEKMTTGRGAERIYLFGKLFLKNPTLQINGQAVPVQPNGTFITYLPVEQGEFAFLLTAQSEGQTYQALRHVRVPGVPLKNFEGKARFDEQEIYPSRPLWALPGDVINLSARGTPGAQVWARVQGLKGGKHIDLKEDARTPGLYRGKFLVRENEKPRSAKITYTLTHKPSRSKAKITAGERLKILDGQEPLRPARVTDPGVKLRQIPVHQGSLYPFYRAFGEVLVDGRNNGLYRLRLGHGESAWLEEKKLAFFSPRAYEENRLSDVHVFADGEQTQVRFSAHKQVPVSVHEFNNRLEVTFYYTPVFEENFNFDASGPILERMEWTAPQDGVIKFILYLKEDAALWGHAYRYEKQDFVLELRHRPVLAPQPGRPLAGARILIDAGHSPKRTPPYDGLVSPSGYLEYEANLALAEALKPKLEAAGATVLLSRRGQNQMSLPARYQMALREKAHIFVSLHHNALPDTVNPLAVPRGYSVYYTYPHSFKLAESVYRAFNARIPLPDNGLLANDVLFIPRMPELPSILVENAYMILPEQEDLVMSEQGRELFAETLYQGILDFYGVRPEKKGPAKRRKPQGKKRN